MTEPRPLNSPRPGFFTDKLVKHGPLVAARIHRPCNCSINGDGDEWSSHPWQESCDRFPHLVAEIDGNVEDDLERVWMWGKEIDEADYQYRLSSAAWDTQYDPDSPGANPGKPIDTMSIRPLF